MASRAQIKAAVKYNKEKTILVSIRLNKETDKDIIEILNCVCNKQGFIKELIRVNDGNLDEYGIFERYAKYPQYIIEKARYNGIDPKDMHICGILGGLTDCTFPSGNCDKCIRKKVMKAAEKAETKKS